MNRDECNFSCWVMLVGNMPLSVISNLFDFIDFNATFNLLICDAILAKSVSLKSTGSISLLLFSSLLVHTSRQEILLRSVSICQPPSIFLLDVIMTFPLILRSAFWTRNLGFWYEFQDIFHKPLLHSLMNVS